MPMIALGKGNYARVDGADMPAVMLHNWSLDAPGRYAISRIKGKFVYLHRFLMPGAALVDHIDGDGLNCSRCNLRSVTASQNSMNSRKAGTRAKSKWKGVTKLSNGWMARIKIDGNAIYLGCFKHEDDAGRAYNKAAAEHFGEYARPNEIPVPVEI